MSADLKKEQQATLTRPRYRYSLASKGFFLSMDLVAGKKMTLAKARVLEILASIPYRAWEIRQYGRLTRHHDDETLVRQARSIMRWGREAQDNEYTHLLVIQEKMKEDGLKKPWYLFRPLTAVMVAFYIVFTRLMAYFHIRRAFLFNAEFEDHAEHEYAELVRQHPEWETQPVGRSVVQEYGRFDSWADVFRRISLDERDHRNSSFAFCGKPEFIVKYEGMPEVPPPEEGV